MMGLCHTYHILPSMSHCHVAVSSVDEQKLNEVRGSKKMLPVDAVVVVHVLYPVSLYVL